MSLTIRHQWFQFSLKGLLLFLTVCAVWLGWNVERARRRGRAIDAIVEVGNTVFYYDLRGQRSEMPKHVDHFWHDLRRFPVSIILYDVDRSIANNLQAATPLGVVRFMLDPDIRDDELTYLNGLGRCTVYVNYKKSPSAALDEFHRRNPKVTIYFSRQLPPRLPLK